MATNAISTKYIGYTNTKPSRVKAFAPGGQFTTRPWDHELDQLQNHAKVALALAKELNWKGDWVAGATKEGYVFVNTRLAGHDFVTEEKR